MTPATPTVLISCYFPRSVELEGVGSLARGLGNHLAHQHLRGDNGLRSAAWRVRLLLPAGQYKHLNDLHLLDYQGGMLGMRRYKAALADNTADADLVLMIENNPNMVSLASASRSENTFCMFCTPLQDLGLLSEVGLTAQAVKHALSKHRLIARLLRWKKRRVIVGSEFQATQLRALGAGEVHVLPVCGLSSQQEIPSRQVARAKLQWDDRPVIGYLGHFSSAKGVDVLVGAMGCYQGPAVLALAHSGKGQLRPASRQALAKLDEQGKLRQMGVVDVPTFLAACDVVVLPYVTSSIFHQPQVMLESLASSTAVITTNLGGFSEIVRDGQTGRIVPPRDSSGLCAAMTAMIADLKRTHEMGRSGREMFLRQFCMEAFWQQLTGLMR